MGATIAGGQNANTAGDMAASRSAAFDTNNFNDNVAQGYAAGSLANAGTVTGLQLQYNQGAADLTNYGQQYSNTVTGDENTYNNQIASNNLNALGNLAQQAAIPRDSTYNDNTYSNQVDQYNTNAAYLTQQQGTAQQDYNNEALYDTQQSGLSNQLQGLQIQGAANTQSDQDRAARYAAEANGGGTTQASYGANLASDLGTYQNQSATAQNTNAQSQSLLQRRGDDATSTLTKSSQSIANQAANLYTGLKQNTLDTGEKNAQLQDQLGQLKIAADQYGVNATQLTQSLNTTLANLNLQGQMTAGQVLTDMGSANAQIAATNQTIWYTAVQNALNLKNLNG